MVGVGVKEAPEKTLHYTHVRLPAVANNTCTHTHTHEQSSALVGQWIHAVFDKGIPHPLADHHCDHDGDDVVETARQLKHDHNQGHCRRGDQTVTQPRYVRTCMN